MTRSYGWNRQRLQRTNSRNNNQSTLHGDSFVVHVFLFAATTAHDPATPRSRPGAMSAVDPGPPSPLNGPRRRSVAAPTRPRRRRYALPVLGPISGATGHLHPPGHRTHGNYHRGQPSAWVRVRGYGQRLELRLGY